MERGRTSLDLDFFTATGLLKLLDPGTTRVRSFKINLSMFIETSVRACICIRVVFIVIRRKKKVILNRVQSLAVICCFVACVNNTLSEGLLELERMHGVGRERSSYGW